MSGHGLGPHQHLGVAADPAREAATSAADLISQVGTRDPQLLAKERMDVAEAVGPIGHSRYLVRRSRPSKPLERRGAGGYIRAMLNVIQHGSPTDRPALLIAHGLFGSARNWGVIARRLSDTREVLAVDMRNHGESFHDPVHDYPAMAADLAQVIERHGGPVDVAGHSMGGKAAMVLALTQPELVRKLVVLDIAPVGYGHTQMPSIEAMRRVDLATVATRGDAEAQMQADPSLAPFLLQSLDLKERRWKLNLDALSANMGVTVGFPEVQGRFDGPTLFLSGEESTYVLPEHRARIKALFPSARFARVKGAGHWLHADRPRETEAAVQAFLDA